MQNHVSQYKRQVSVNLSPVQIQWWANCSVEGLGIVLGLVVGGYETIYNICYHCHSSETWWWQVDCITADCIPWQLIMQMHVFSEYAALPLYCCDIPTLTKCEAKLVTVGIKYAFGILWRSMATQCSFPDQASCELLHIKNGSCLV